MRATLCGAEEPSEDVALEEEVDEGIAELEAEVAFMTEASVVASVE